VGLLNSGGFYDGLVAFWATMSEVGFVRPQHVELLIVGDTLDTLLARMAGFQPVQTIVATKASDL
jgi:hypothetical protein